MTNTTLRPSPGSGAIGTHVGDYVLIREIGAGGMGRVFEAAHATLGRRVAIKVLTAGLEQGELVGRFFNEAHAAVRIHHPSIVDVLHCGVTADRHAYIVMELLHGESLAARLERVGRLGLDESIAIARRVARGLAAAHAAGVIHRDIKPGNVYLALDAETGAIQVKVLDFGIAKLAEGRAGQIRTQRHAVFGTPAYMSPEQWRSAASVDARADLYSLGCLLFKMLSGEPPFPGRSEVEIAFAHVYRDPPPLASRVAGLPPALGALVNRMIAKDREHRPATAQQVVSELDALVASPPRRRALIAITASALVSGGIAAIGAPRPSALATAAPAVSAVSPIDVAPAPSPSHTKAEPASPPVATVLISSPPPGAPVATSAQAAPARPRGHRRRSPALAAPTAQELLDLEAIVAARTEGATRAFQAGDRQQALELCTGAIALAPESDVPVPICAMAACSLGFVDQGASYVARLPATRRDGFARYCRVVPVAP